MEGVHRGVSGRTHTVGSGRDTQRREWERHTEEGVGGTHRGGRWRCTQRREWVGCAEEGVGGIQRE